MITPKLHMTSHVTLQSSFKDIVPNADSKLGDVCLVSADRKYFLAHRIVLVSASEILSTLLAINCDYCDKSSDENVVILFDKISGSVLQNFLSLIYTGISVGLKREKEASDLMNLCQQLKLRSFESLVKPVSGPNYPISNAVTSGFQEIDPPPVNTVTSASKFMHLPKDSSNPFALDSYDDFNLPCKTILKTEPEDINDLDYDPEDEEFNPMEIDLPELSGFTNEDRSLRFLGDQERKIGSNFDTDEDSMDVKPDMEDEPLRKTRKRTKHKLKPSFDKRQDRLEIYKDIPSRKENDLWYCLSGSCESKGQSFRYIKSLREHYFDKHASDDQKHFPCKVCGKKFGTFGQRNRHQKAHDGFSDFQCSSCDQTFDQKSLLEEHMQSHSIPSRKENDLWYCISDDCEIKGQSFQHFGSLREHYMDKHVPESEKHFPCNVCGKLFGTLGLLNRHLKTHADDEEDDSINFYPDDDDGQFSRRKLVLVFENLPDKLDLYKDIPTRKEGDHWCCLSEDCEIQGQFFASISSLREHFMDKHATEDQKHFLCKICGKLFGTFGLRRNHYKTHEGFSEYECFTCDQKFDQKFLLDEHIKTHTIPACKVNDYWLCLSGDCESTGQSFKYISGLREHYMEKHATDDQKHYPCKFCGKFFGTLALQKRHHKTHNENEENSEYACSLCNKSYGRKVLLERHMKSHYTESEGLKQKKSFECDKCGKLFDQQFLLNKHLVVHSEERPYVCDECGRSYKTSADLRFHKERHTDNEISCELCDKKFKAQRFYRKHYLYKHRFNFECHLCHKKFSYQHILDAHLNWHKGDRPYICEICGASYPLQSSLKHHIAVIHEKKKRAKDKKCPHCEKAFCTTAELKTHMSFHSDERNCVCNECGKAYKIKAHLMKHMETHSGITVSCEHCDRSFNSRTYYLKHVARKHRPKPNKSA